MPRKLTEASQTLRLRDPIGGECLTLYYRIPTSEERLAYQTSAFRIEGGGPRLKLAETRLDFGLTLLTGFAPGDFTLEIDGEERPLEVDAEGQWKDCLKRLAPDVVSFLGQYIFEGLRVASEAAPSPGEWEGAPVRRLADGALEVAATGRPAC